MKKIICSAIVAVIVLVSIFGGLSVAFAANDYTEDEILLAKVIQMEGGTTDESRKAIGSVVINRLNNYTKWKDKTISDVVYHAGQFSVVKNSKFETLEPKIENLEAARYVIINGPTIPLGVEYFKGGSKGTLKSDGLYYWGSHVYYKTINGNNFYFRDKATYTEWQKNGGDNGSQDTPSDKYNSPAAAKTHIVKRGETLSKLARKYKLSIAAIKKANPYLRGNMLIIGKRLAIPAVAPPASTNPPVVSDPPTTTDNPQIITITVEKGDTLSGLARKYGTTVAKIKSLNDLKSDVIVVGMTLKIETTK